MLAVEMAKIGQVGIGSYIPAQLNGENKGKTEKSRKSRFGNLLTPADGPDGERLPIEAVRLSGLDEEEALEELIDRLFESGEELKRLPVEEKFKEYKENIRILVNYVSQKSYDVVREKGVVNPRNFNRKQYVNVELINNKLDNLAAYILSRQKDQFELLRRVDEINGLIINVIR